MPPLCDERDARRTGDCAAAWRQTLKDFADGKGALNTLLKEAGLAVNKSQQDNAVTAFIGRELKRVDESGAKTKYQIVTVQDGDKVWKYVQLTDRLFMEKTL